MQEEGKKIVESLAKLKYELQHNRQLTYVYESLDYSTCLKDVSDHCLMMVNPISRPTMRNLRSSNHANGTTCRGFLLNAISIGMLLNPTTTAKLSKYQSDVSQRSLLNLPNGNLTTSSRVRKYPPSSPLVLRS